MAINRCIQCEAVIPDGLKVCPHCAHPIMIVKHAHEWNPLKLKVDKAKTMKNKFVCHKCGRIGMKSAPKMKSTNKSK